MKSVARRALALARTVFTPLALLALGVFAWSARDTLAAVLGGAVPAWLALAILAWVALHFASALFATCMLRIDHPQIDWRTALTVHGLRLPARYLPGGIWHAVARAADYATLGVPTRSVVRYVLVEQAAAATVPLALGALGLAWLRSGDLPAWLSPWIVPAGVLAVLALVVSLGVVLARPALSAPLRQPAQWFGGLAVMVLVMTLGGTAFACFLAALPGVAGAMPTLDAALAWVFGWSVGFLAVFAPQGIGVTETVTAAVLGGPLGLEATAVVLAAFRVVILAADLAVTALAFALRPPAAGAVPPPRDPPPPRRD